MQRYGEIKDNVNCARLKAAATPSKISAKKPAGRRR
jgi:hypothetical protein